MKKFDDFSDQNISDELLKMAESATNEDDKCILRCAAMKIIPPPKPTTEYVINEQGWLFWHRVWR